MCSRRAQLKDAHVLAPAWAHIPHFLHAIEFVDGKSTRRAGALVYLIKLLRHYRLGCAVGHQSAPGVGISRHWRMFSGSRRVPGVRHLPCVPTLAEVTTFPISASYSTSISLFPISTGLGGPLCQTSSGRCMLL